MAIKKTMLSEIQKSKFSAKAKEEARKLLQALNIEKLTDENIGELQSELDLTVASLVTQKEIENRSIDEELLDIYDLLIDVLLDNEEDLDFLNTLFFN